METLSGVDREAAAEECGVPLEGIELAAEKYANANNAAIFTGMGMSQHPCGVDNVQKEINPALITGPLGRAVRCRGRRRRPSTPPSDADGRSPAAHGRAVWVGTGRDCTTDTLVEVSKVPCEGKRQRNVVEEIRRCA